MAQTCLVKFPEHTQARNAVRQLMQHGIDPGAMEVMSSQPIHGGPIVPETKPTKLRTWALSGACVGFIGGLSLASITALNYPLVKGGMPIVAPWTVSSRTKRPCWAPCWPRWWGFSSSSVCRTSRACHTIRASWTAASCSPWHVPTVRVRR
jgi:hypothetical protein